MTREGAKRPNAGRWQNNGRKEFYRDLNPITQLYLCLFIAVSSLFYDYRYTAVLIVVMIAIAAMAGKAGEFVGMWLKSIVLISGGVCWSCRRCFCPGDTVLWKFWIFSIKQEGIDNAVTLCTRIMGVGTAAVLGIKLVDVGSWWWLWRTGACLRPLPM